MTHYRLKRRQIAAFALPSLPLSALGLPLAVYIPPLYAQETALSVALVGTLAFAARLFDVVTDPIFGFLSDRINTRFGRRRPWMVISVPILMLSVHKLFHPPADAGALYLGLWLFALYLGVTLNAIAHMAWGAELSPDYDERSRIHGWREFGLVGGMLTVMVLPLLLQAAGLDTGLRDIAGAMSAFILVLLPLTVGIAVVSVPEFADARPPALGRHNYLAMLRSLLHNPYLVRILTADLFQAVAPAMTGAVYIWMAVHHLKLAGSENLILFAYFLSATIAMPLWVHLAYRIGKHKAFSVAMVYAAVTLIAFLAIPEGNLVLAVLITAAYGVAFGAGNFLLRAIMADVADHEKLTTGAERTGLYYSLLTLTGKFGAAMGPFIAYNFLGRMGFDPKGSVSEADADWVLFIFVGPPAIALAVAGAALWGFSLDRARHRQMRDGIARRAESTAAKD